MSATRRSALGSGPRRRLFVERRTGFGERKRTRGITSSPPARRQLTHPAESQLLLEKAGITRGAAYGPASEGASAPLGLATPMRCLIPQRAQRLCYSLLVGRPLCFLFFLLLRTPRLLILFPLDRHTPFYFFLAAARCRAVLYEALKCVDPEWHPRRCGLNKTLAHSDPEARSQQERSISAPAPPPVPPFVTRQTT